MPTYIGSGKRIYLVTCEDQPNLKASKKEKERHHKEVCEKKCGFFRETVQRAKKASQLKKPFRRLVCIRPTNKKLLKYWKKHVTRWGVKTNKREK